jgi:sugar lactone lactonase YvrE
MAPTQSSFAAAFLALLLLLTATIGSSAERPTPIQRSDASPAATSSQSSPATLCELTGALYRPASSLAHCTYLAVDPSTARQLLLGHSAAAASSLPTSGVSTSSINTSSGTSTKQHLKLPSISVVAQSAAPAATAAASTVLTSASAVEVGAPPQQQQAPTSTTAAAAAAAPPSYHESAIWLSGFPGPHSVLFTSDRLGDLSGPDQFVNITLVDPTGAAPPRALASVHSVAPMLNGGTLVPGTGGAVVLLTFQGIRARGGGLVALNVNTGEARVVASAAGASGGQFSSPNAVVVVPLARGSSGGRAGGREAATDDGESSRYAVALFTDPSYGADQLFRTAPPEHGEYVWAVTLRLPSPAAVRRAAGGGGQGRDHKGGGGRKTGAGSGSGSGSPGQQDDDEAARWWPEAISPARVVADGFIRPNGVAVSPDRKTVYVSDTSYYSGDDEQAAAAPGAPTPPPSSAQAAPSGSSAGAGAASTVFVWRSRPRTIYRFDLSSLGAAPATAVLSNRRTFAVADVPIPDGLHVDADGRVWSGEGDGVSVYEPETGRLLMRVRPGDGGGARAGKVAGLALVGGGNGEGGVLVMGQEQAATAVRLPGLRVFDTNSWV